MNAGTRANTHNHACTRKKKKKKAGCHLSGCRQEPWKGEICPVMALNEGCGGAVTLRLAGTRERRGAARGGGHGHCVLI